jgi:phosphoribosylanthranilate isomerase
MTSHVRVKICGITNRDDALAAIACGADALGFNLFPGSKRHVVLDDHEAWLRGLPPFVTRVAVLVNAPLDEARRVATHPAIDAVQLHGDEDAAYIAELVRGGRPVIRALRVRCREALAEAAACVTPHVLLDAHVTGEFGGTGALTDLDIAAEIVRTQPALNIILAGGLHPGNVAGAISRVRPFAVDVASGVEVEPRRKDVEKMRSFCAAVRGAGNGNP